MCDACSLIGFISKSFSSLPCQRFCNLFCFLLHLSLLFSSSFYYKFTTCILSLYLSYFNVCVVRIMYLLYLIYVYYLQIPTFLILIYIPTLTTLYFLAINCSHCMILSSRMAPLLLSLFFMHVKKIGKLL